MLDTKVNLAGIVRESIVDGPGIRFVVFCQGCPHGCKGCHNPESHPFGVGTDVRIGKMLEEIDKDPMLDGVTFSGGEPFEQAEPLYEMAKEIHKRNLSVFAFSGYRYEELLKKGEDNHFVMDLLSECDYLVDGRFVLAERDLTLKFRGSRNQRIIDIKKTQNTGEIVLAEEFM